jgi:hypothetical protein
VQRITKKIIEDLFIVERTTYNSGVIHDISEILRKSQNGTESMGVGIIWWEGKT